MRCYGLTTERWMSADKRSLGRVANENLLEFDENKATKGKSNAIMEGLSPECGGRANANLGLGSMRWNNSLVKYANPTIWYSRRQDASHKKK